MSVGDTSEDEKLNESDDEDHDLDHVVHQLNRLSVAQDLKKIHCEEFAASFMNNVQSKPKMHA